MDAIPVIDIAPFRNGSKAEARQVVDAVQRACETIGFFTVTGHGVPEPLVERVYRNGREFFALPLDEKLKIEKPEGARYKGFGPMRSRTIGRSRDPNLRPSLNESFAMGFVDVTDDAYFRSPDAGTHYEPNVYPAAPADFKPAICDYYHAMEGLSGTILRIFAAALDVPDAFFLSKLDRHISVLRVVNYPALAAEPTQGEERAGAHSDTGAITILRIDDPPGQAGLQARTPKGDQWIDVFRIPDSFVVNIGDTMMRWTNDRFISTMHRVVNPPVINGHSRQRISVPYFCQPNYDAVIECIPSCAGPDNPPRYAPITSGDILSNRYKSSYSLDKAKAS